MSSRGHQRTNRPDHTRRVSRAKVVGTVSLAGTLIAVGIGAASATSQTRATFQTRATARTKAAPTVSCPDVAGRLAGVEIPADAKAAVDAQLALLNTQINNANRTLASTVGQGGPDFIPNAVLRPLNGKRFSALERITIAIGRRGTAPQGLAALANCTLNANGLANAQAPKNQPAQTGNTTAVDPNTTAEGERILGNNCQGTRLQPHDGFQNGNRCVTTSFGEVPSEDKNATLLITSAPRTVRPNQPFDLRVSTRNLVRDRFLPAAQGGYYKESSFLTSEGIVRGHFHTACRRLASTNVAPDPAPVPDFFVATEDNKGGRAPDTVTIRVTGLPAGEAQCTVWAGDGSHRTPMMQRANQTPAIDSVRITVR